VGIGAEGLAFDPPVHPFQAVNATPINPQILGHLLGRHSCRLAVFFQEEFVGVRASLHWNDMGGIRRKEKRRHERFIACPGADVQFRFQSLCLTQPQHAPAAATSIQNSQCQPPRPCNILDETRTERDAWRKPWWGRAG
jgi:hypothetical protein